MSSMGLVRVDEGEQRRLSVDSLFTSPLDL
jgi:hypothetical protein